MSVSQIGESHKDQNGSKASVRLYVYVLVLFIWGFPGGTSGKEPAC